MKYIRTIIRFILYAAALCSIIYSFLLHMSSADELITGELADLSILPQIVFRLFWDSLPTPGSYETHLHYASLKPSISQLFTPKGYPSPSVAYTQYHHSQAFIQAYNQSNPGAPLPPLNIWLQLSNCFNRACVWWITRLVF